MVCTGGTFGARGVPLDTVDVAEYLGKLRECLTHLGLGEHEYDVEQPFRIDSSAADPTHWARLQWFILERYEAYGAFVVVHGTDTLAYTAAALNFLLENFDRPVVLTGSQVPLMHATEDRLLLEGDAPTNLIGAVQAALWTGAAFSAEQQLELLARFDSESERFVRAHASRWHTDAESVVRAHFKGRRFNLHQPLLGVHVFFCGKLMHGTRVVKTHASGVDAFHAPKDTLVAVRSKGALHVDPLRFLERQVVRWGLRRHFPTLAEMESEPLFARIRPHPVDLAGRAGGAPLSRHPTGPVRLPRRGGGGVSNIRRRQWPHRPPARRVRTHPARAPQPMPRVRNGVSGRLGQRHVRRELPGRAGRGRGGATAGHDRGGRVRQAVLRAQ